MSKGMSKGKMITAWLTKYALTRGVEQEDVEISGDYAYSRGRWSTQYPPGHWHRTEEAAVKRAEEMRRVKIASLEKQIVKLKKLRFGR